MYLALFSKTISKCAIYRHRVRTCDLCDQKHPPTEAEQIRAGLIKEADARMEIPGWKEYKASDEYVPYRRVSDVGILNKSSKSIELLWKRMEHYRSTKGSTMEKHRSSLPAAKYK